MSHERREGSEIAKLGVSRGGGPSYGRAAAANTLVGGSRCEYKPGRWPSASCAPESGTHCEERWPLTRSCLHGSGTTWLMSLCRTRWWPPYLARYRRVASVKPIYSPAGIRYIMGSVIIIWGRRISRLATRLLAALRRWWSYWVAIWSVVCVHVVEICNQCY